MRCLHFSRNPDVIQPVSTDRLQKIRFVQDYLNNKIDEIRYPNNQLSIDEPMMARKDGLVFRQYVKNKKHKYEMKLNRTKWNSTMVFI